MVLPLAQSLRRFSTTRRRLSREVFVCTSTRWLRDEERKLAQLHRKFDVDALKSVIASSITGQSVVGFHKLAEGSCNKVFQAQLANDRNVVARVPTRLAGKPHLVTASEVATMRFLRDRLCLTQVPRIISWSTHASSTPVGAEYIIMDAPEGVELSRLWPRLSKRQKLEVVHEWVQFELKIIQAIQGDGYGAIYHRTDIPAEHACDLYLAGAAGPDSDFVLGPAMRPPAFWEAENGVLSGLELDNGPWPDTLAYLKSIINNERALIRRSAKRPSREYAAPWEPPAHLKDPADHIRMLDMYDKVSEFFIPKGKNFLRPTVGLLNSDANSILLSKEAFDRDGTIEISAVTNWQQIAVLPLYLSAGLPRFIHEASAASETDPELLLQEQNHLTRAYQELYACTGWEIPWASALNVQTRMSETVAPLAPTTVWEPMLPMMAQHCWHGGYVKLRTALMVMARQWDTLFPDLASEHGNPLHPPGTPAPFSDAEIDTGDMDNDAWVAALDARQAMEKEIGGDGEGGVDAQDYEKAIRTSQRLFAEWKDSLSSDDLLKMNGATPEGVWPYTLKHK